MLGYWRNRQRPGLRMRQMSEGVSTNKDTRFKVEDLFLNLHSSWFGAGFDPKFTRLVNLPNESKGSMCSVPCGDTGEDGNSGEITHVQDGEGTRPPDLWSILH
ncbi:hypothetical protein Y1Q_0019164 [Alligator mississippiensis]|uniref:Uncharacterized protein n=1 Tax=Alligator mississippiensis TaxID=8496 RepID=A0A151MQ86_ALLMI|nr:hypothetical protein Y1Q_0019164 [Alligator mississippiensis]